MNRVVFPVVGYLVQRFWSFRPLHLFCVRHSRSFGLFGVAFSFLVLAASDFLVSDGWLQYSPSGKILIVARCRNG